MVIFFFFFLAALGLCCYTRAFSSCGAQASYYCWLLLLQSTGSRMCGLSCCGSRVLEHKLSSCGTRDLGALKHVGSFLYQGLTLSLELAGRFFTTEPPGKPPTIFLNLWTACSYSLSIFQFGCLFLIDLYICALSFIFYIFSWIFSLRCSFSSN